MAGGLPFEESGAFGLEKPANEMVRRLIHLRERVILVAASSRRDHQHADTFGWDRSGQDYLSPRGASSPLSRCAWMRYIGSQPKQRRLRMGSTAASMVFTVNERCEEIRGWRRGFPEATPSMITARC